MLCCVVMCCVVWCGVVAWCVALHCVMVWCGVVCGIALSYLCDIFSTVHYHYQYIYPPSKHLIPHHNSFFILEFHPRSLALFRVNEHDEGLTNVDSFPSDPAAVNKFLAEGKLFQVRYGTVRYSAAEYVMFL